MTSFVAAIVAAILTLTAGSAAAEDGLIQVNPFGAHLEGSAFFEDENGPNSGIVLPGMPGLSSFAVGFEVPGGRGQRQRAVRKIDVELTWIARDAMKCDIALLPMVISIARPNSGYLVQTESGDEPTFFSQYGDILHVSDDPEKPRVSTYVIRAPKPVPSLQAGDSINFGFLRSPHSQWDTCRGDLIIEGIALRMK